MKIFEKIIVKIDKYAKDLLVLSVTLGLMAFGAYIVITGDFTLRSGVELPEPFAVGIGIILVGIGIWASYYPVKSIIQKNKSLS